MSIIDHRDVTLFPFGKGLQNGNGIRALCRAGTGCLHDKFPFSLTPMTTCRTRKTRVAVAQMSCSPVQSRSIAGRIRTYRLHLISSISLIFISDYLQGSLETHLNNRFDNVKLIRTDGMGGLIRSRLMAARVATGDVLLFLTSRSEPNINYLPPLLGRKG
jgi:hypothetical protein